MTPALILQAVLQFGPTIIPLISQLAAWAEGGKKEVTAADLAQLVALGTKTSADYLREAGVNPSP